MQSEFLNLTHEQQQAAVEQIQRLMQQGVSSGEAIARVANALREAHQNSGNISNDFCVDHGS